ncbi:hypothetical protein M0802_005626 [Mischocyttarus mexicanus]|nr:hypothetical protein M0802_005626 [Mischocyttarus mexicanus]
MTQVIRFSIVMAPNLFGTLASLFLEASQPGVLKENSKIEKTISSKLEKQKLLKSQPKYKWNIVWRNVIAFLYLHIGSIYGLYIAFTAAKLYTTLFALSTGFVAGFGVTAGAHRLWAHRSYKAKWPMRVILMFWQTLAFQNHIYEWVRDHRVHHKFTDTDADPHNSQRGFFFSHIGWLMLRKHPDVIKKRLYIILMPLICFIIPTWIPVHFWGESPMYAWYITIFRYTLTLNITWLVNSAAHIWGTKPYDSTISPTDSYSVGLAAFGEGWHNYHHVFPWDYKTSELGIYRINFTTAIIDGFAKLGLAYNLKTVSHEMIKKRASRTGDGTKYEHDENHQHNHTHSNAVWGWDDPDIIPEDVQDVRILNKVGND